MDRPLHAEGTVTIVLARVEMTGIRKTGRMVRRDMNWFPEVEAAPEPKALVWVNAGTKDDVAAASRYAEDNGYRVFTYPTNEGDPLGAARRSIMADQKESDRWI